jgi:Rrf2 family transcriptional regulator, iron-sulfur cluster assembly transcription factor
MWFVLKFVGLQVKGRYASDCKSKEAQFYKLITEYCPPIIRYVTPNPTFNFQLSTQKNTPPTRFETSSVEDDSQFSTFYFQLSIFSCPLRPKKLIFINQLIKDSFIRNKFLNIYLLGKGKNMFSKACEYALKIMIYMASIEGNGKRMGLKDIAGAISSPEAFTAKILQQLVRNGLLNSLRGPNGGFELRSQRPIRLLEIVVAIDGEGIIKNCVLGLDKCSNEMPCPAHDKFMAVRDHLTGILSSTTLEEIKGGIVDGNRFLKS